MHFKWNYEEHSTPELAKFGKELADKLSISPILAKLLNSIEALRQNLQPSGFSVPSCLISSIHS